MIRSQRVRRLVGLGVVFLLMVAACGDDDEVTATAAPATTAAPTTTAAATTAAAPATTAASTPTPTVTWTAGGECVYSGPDTFPKGNEIVKFTYRNESSVLVAVIVSPGPGEALSRREVDPDTELTNSVIFRDAGDLALVCQPGDGQFVIGGLLTVEESSTASPPTTLSPEAQQEALAVAEAYFAAFNAGDRDAVMGSFTADVSIRDSFEEMLLAWNIAQGTMLTAADCAVTEASSSGAVTVTCESGTHHALTQAIGAPPVPTTLIFLVVPEGIRELTSNFGFGEPDFNHTMSPFLRWLRGSHPEDADRVGFGIWNSVAEAEQNGLLFAQYAEEWAAFLDASDCVYPDVCFRILTEG